MKSLLASLALTTALTVPGLVQARPVTFTTTLNAHGGDGAYLALNWLRKDETQTDQQEQRVN